MFQWYRDAARCYVFLSDVSVASATDDWEASFQESDGFTQAWTLQELIAPVLEGQSIDDKASLDQLLHDITGIPLTARCHVPLSDVSVASATEASQGSSWEASFRESNWFTRGWTLQELIAPVSVEFFSREGQRIGDKASLNQLLHDITGIPLAALRNCRLNDFPQSERRRWAKNRRTTEEEDIVYCLLGIIGVSMPTAYGEGLESARNRLQAELDGASNAPSIIPFSQSHRFIGRESQLTELEAKLFTNEQTTTTLAIVGPGGTGKSQLALETAHRTRQNNKNCSVFWIDASDKDSLYQSYASIARKLKVPGWDDDQADMKQLAKRCVVEISARQCLLIFDNTEHTTLQSGGSSTTEAADLIDCLPQSKLCSIIFTTTNSTTAETLAPQNLIELQELAPDMAQRMLQNHLATPLMSSEHQEAKLLLKELSYLPLALAQAAACINAGSITLQEYRSQLDEHKKPAIEHSSGSSEAKIQDRGTEDPVATTLFLSIDQVRRDNALAADYLFLAACVDRKDISVDLFEASSSRAREDAIKVLDKYALVTRRPAESALDLHRLVHRALHERLLVQGQLGQFAQHAITQLFRVFPDDDHSNRSKWRRLLPHVQNVLSHSQTDDDDEEKWVLAWKCAMALYSDGRYKEAEELQVQVLQTSKRVLGSEHLDTLTIIGNLAATYSNQRRWREAEELEVQVTQIRKRVLGDEHPDTLISMGNLASTYWKQGRYKEAEELQVQVIQTEKRVLGNEHLNTLTNMGNLASTYRKQERWKEAEELEVQVMQTRKRVLGDEHPYKLTSMANLAPTYLKQGRWKEAEELEVRVMQIRKRVLGNEHPDTLASMHNLAFTLRSEARHEEAFALMERCCQLREQFLGEQHPGTQSSLNMLSDWRAECSNKSP